MGQAIITNTFTDAIAEQKYNESRFLCDGLQKHITDSVTAIEKEKGVRVHILRKYDDPNAPFQVSLSIDGEKFSK